MSSLKQKIQILDKFQSLKGEVLVRYDDILRLVSEREEQLQKLWDERPNFDETEASKPLESLLVSRAKCVEWFKRLKKELKP